MPFLLLSAWSRLALRKFILERIQAESLAVVGLMVALIALGYNTWRNELTEQNQTVRYASFEMLLKVGELQSILYAANGLESMQKETATRGEIVVLGLRDLSMFMPENVQGHSKNLVLEWRRSSVTLSDESEFSLALIDTKLNELRLGIIKAVKSLE